MYTLSLVLSLSHTTWVCSFGLLPHMIHVGSIGFVPKKLKNTQFFIFICFRLSRAVTVIGRNLVRRLLCPIRISRTEFMTPDVFLAQLDALEQSSYSKLWLTFLHYGRSLHAPHLPIRFFA
jgi:hypothetical protein